MNKVILIGRLTRDPELRTTTSGLATVTFTVAVDRPFVNQQTGQREADFITCVAWRKQAESIARYCTKGTQVAVEGRMQTRSYDAQDGSKRYVTEVICSNVTFLGSSSRTTNNTYDNSSSNSEPLPNVETTNLDEDPYANMGDEVALTDDDLPFDFN